YCMLSTYCLEHFTVSFLPTHAPLSFFFNDPAPPEIYPLSLHDALPISPSCASTWNACAGWPLTWSPTCCWWISPAGGCGSTAMADRKSTRLNSSYVKISYAVFCLKKKKEKQKTCSKRSRKIRNIVQGAR